MDWFFAARSDYEPALSVGNFLGPVGTFKALTAMFVFVGNLDFLGITWSADKQKNVLFCPILRGTVRSCDLK